MVGQSRQPIDAEQLVALQNRLLVLAIQEGTMHSLLEQTHGTLDQCLYEALLTDVKGQRSALEAELVVAERAHSPWWRRWRMRYSASS